MTKESAFAFALALASVSATAQTAPQPAGVLSLSAQASREVPQDVVDITLFYEQEAKDPASLTAALNQHADTALRKAKSSSDVTARTGSFSIYPSTDRDGRISAWRGRTEVLLESRNFEAASKLAGNMNPDMQVGNVAFSLSPEARRTAEQKLSGEAIASFRQQATAAAQAFGYSSYTIREVNVGHNSVMPRPAMFAMRAASADTSSAPVPIEGGTSTVSVNVSGSVQMK